MKMLAMAAFRFWLRSACSLRLSAAMTKGVGSRSDVMSRRLPTPFALGFLLQFLDEVVEFQAARFLHVAQAGEEFLLAELLPRPFEEPGRKLSGREYRQRRGPPRGVGTVG